MSHFSMINVDVTPWVRHFERQAKTGSTPRSTYNKHYIVVQSKGDNQDHSSHQTGPGPAIISPVQQSVEQAEEEVKRDQGQEVKTEVISQLNGSSNNNCEGVNKVKRKRYSSNIRKCSTKKQRLVKDIFSRK